MAFWSYKARRNNYISSIFLPDHKMMGASQSAQIHTYEVQDLSFHEKSLLLTLSQDTIFLMARMNRDRQAISPSDLGRKGFTVAGAAFLVSGNTHEGLNVLQVIPT